MEPVNVNNLNIPLLIFDFIVILPITLLRLIIIYFYSSKYGIANIDDFIENSGTLRSINKKKNTNNAPKITYENKFSKENEEIIDTITKLINEGNLSSHDKHEKTKKQDKLKSKKTSSSDISTECIYSLIQTVEKEALERKKDLNKGKNLSSHDEDTLNDMLMSLLDSKVVKDTSISSKKSSNSLPTLNIPKKSDASDKVSIDFSFTDDTQ